MTRESESKRESVLLVGQGVGAGVGDGVGYGVGANTTINEQLRKSFIQTLILIDVLSLLS